MTDPSASDRPGLDPSVWDDAVQSAALYSVDPVGTGGIAVRAQAGPVRDRFLALIAGPMRRMPASIADDALLGGLDLAATLRAGRPVRSRGLLAEARGGTLLAAMAERMTAALAARLAAALDSGAGIGIVALDEGATEDERTMPALADRLAFHLDLSGVSHRAAGAGLPQRGAIDAARRMLPEVAAEPGVLEAVCAAAVALGIGSPRAVLLALRAAHGVAALDGRGVATMQDAAAAARLVLAPRATQAPASPPGEAAEAEAPSQPGDAPADAGSGEAERASGSEIVLEAARAAIPPGLLARLQAKDFRSTSRSQGSEGARQKAREAAPRGRPVGVRAAAPGPGMRLNFLETLRAAAPWQRVRAAEDKAAPNDGRIRLRREDFRVTRCEQRTRSTTVFVVDASGSSALNRLAEAKGAVELLLAECYRRRDEVAVLAFRGRGAQVLLPPTRSLVRAKRSRAALPGGGGTPLAAGIDAGFLLAETLRRSGCAPTLVFLTDGRANVTRAGAAGRAQAAQDALAASRRLRAGGVSALVLDTSPRPGAEAGALAQAMGALYVPLPYADAAGLSQAVRAAARS